MSEMRIESGLRPEQNFTIIANQLITDRSISADAFRIMAYLLSKPASWQANEKDISRQLGLVHEPGKRSYVYQRAIRELKSAGYLEITKGGDKTKRQFSTWILREPKNIDASKIQSSKDIDALKIPSPKNSITEKLGHHSKTLDCSNTLYLTKKEKPLSVSENKSDSDQDHDQSQSQNQSAGEKSKSHLYLHTSQNGNTFPFYRGKPLYEYEDTSLDDIRKSEGISEQGCMTYAQLRQRIEDFVWSKK